MKVEALRALDLEMAFHRPAAEQQDAPGGEHAFDWVHGIDRLIAERLSAQRDADLPPLNVCIQVNVSGEDSRAAWRRSRPARSRAVAALPQLRLRA